MSAGSKIEWTEATWNPVVGCERVSPGCDRCYAIRDANRLAGNPNRKIADVYEGLAGYRRGRLDWTGRIRTLPDRLTIPLRWRTPRRIFINSQSDLFHHDVADEFIARVFAVMAATPGHTYQLLTKRHGRLRAILGRGEFGTDGFADMVDEAMAEFTHATLDAWPLPNVWVGVSAEDQERAALRIPALLETPAAIRWVSIEPMLGPIDLHGPADRHGHRARLNYWLPPGRPYFPAPEPGDVLSGPITDAPALDWVVVGGESGPGARPLHPDWVRTIRDQCAQAGVPFLMKQWGEWAPARVFVAPEFVNGKAFAHPKGGGTTFAPEHATRSIVRLDDATVTVRVGKRAAGRALDGQIHDEYPQMMGATRA